MIFVVNIIYRPRRLIDLNSLVLKRLTDVMVDISIKIDSKWII
jgi:hypothetical protein